MVSVLLDETAADRFGDAGREKRTLAESLLVSADVEEDEDDKGKEAGAGDNPVS